LSLHYFCLRYDIVKNYYRIVIVPPAFSMLSFAFWDVACAETFNGLLISPVANIFTLSLLLMTPACTNDL
jgi:hypothetical protein